MDACLCDILIATNPILDKECIRDLIIDSSSFSSHLKSRSGKLFFICIGMLRDCTYTLQWNGETSKIGVRMRLIVSRGECVVLKKVKYHRFLLNQHHKKTRILTCRNHTEIEPLRKSVLPINALQDRNLLLSGCLQRLY